jgi:hypothetical protein
MIAVALDAVPTCMLTVVPLGMAGLSVVGLSMWPATMIGRLGGRAAPRCGVARVAAAALRDTGQAPPSVTIGRVVLQA